MSKGWIYCLSNKSMPGLLKIGQTKNCPQIRAEKLQSTGVPLPFKIEIAKKVLHFEKKEKLIHSILESFDKRVNPKREFFEVEVNVVKSIFELIDGEYFSDDEYSIFKEILKDNQEVRYSIGDFKMEVKYSRVENKFLYKEEKITVEEIHEIYCKLNNTDKEEIKYSLSNFELIKDGNWVPIVETV